MRPYSSQKNQTFSFSPRPLSPISQFDHTAPHLPHRHPTSLRNSALPFHSHSPQPISSVRYKKILKKLETKILERKTRKKKKIQQAKEEQNRLFFVPLPISSNVHPSTPACLRFTSNADNFYKMLQCFYNRLLRVAMQHARATTINCCDGNDRCQSRLADDGC